MNWYERCQKAGGWLENQSYALKKLAIKKIISIFNAVKNPIFFNPDIENF